MPLVTLVPVHLTSFERFNRRTGSPLHGSAQNLHWRSSAGTVRRLPQRASCTLQPQGVRSLCLHSRRVAAASLTALPFFDLFRRHTVVFVAAKIIFAI